jgi:hypothetical protein
VSTKIKGSKFDKPVFLKRMVNAFERDVSNDPDNGVAISALI